MNAALGYPEGVAVDTSGNLFIADAYNYRVREVDANGIITTVAGNGNSSFYGDGGAAINAALTFPVGVAVDTSGNLFIADEGNNRVREVNANGIITTVAGNGNSSFYGDGGAAINAALYSAQGVAVDTSGNLFIADVFNYRVREVLNRPPTDLPALLLTDSLENDAGNYSVAITDSTGSVTSSIVALTTVFSPTNRIINASSTATFTVMAFNPELLSYQWQKNGTNLVDGGNLSGSTNNTLTITSVSDADAANYSAVVSDANASITTSNALLTVNDTLMFATQPQSQLVIIGSNANFNVTAYGAPPLVFQWQFNNSPVGSPTTGTNYSSYTLTNVGTNQAGNYTVQVINGSGNVTSSNAVLTVAVSPVITTQPLNRTTNVNTTATFSVAATSALPMSYQWQKNGTNLVNGGKYAGATTNILTITTVSSNEAAIYP